MHDTEYLVAIRASGGLLHAETLRFADEVRTPLDVGLPGVSRAPRELVAEFEHEIEELQKSELARTELSDERTVKLRELIAEKRAHKTDIVKAPEIEVEEADDDEAAPEDLVEVIRRSLRGDSSSGSKRASRSSGRSTKRAAATREESGAGSLASMSKEALYDRARELRIEGRASMSKTELVRALRKHGASQ